MIPGLLSRSLASTIATSAVALAGSIVAYEVLGAEWLAWLWDRWAPAITATAPASSNALETRQEITFFVQEPIAGSAFVVTTGVAYATVADLTSGNALRYWCYINGRAAGGITPRIELGTQDGNADPGYASASDFSEADIAGFGLSAERLAELARSHCRFGSIDPVSADLLFPDPTIRAA